MNSVIWHVSARTSIKDSAASFVERTLMIHSIATRSCVSSAIRLVTLQVSVQRRMSQNVFYAIKSATLNHAVSKFGKTPKNLVAKAGIQIEVSTTSTSGVSNAERLVTSNALERRRARKDI